MFFYSIPCEIYIGIPVFEISDVFLNALSFQRQHHGRLFEFCCLLTRISSFLDSKLNDLF